MRTALLLIFVTLFFSNYWICEYMFPLAWESIDGVMTLEGAIQADKWTSFRYAIYQFMFLTLVPIGYFETSRMSKALMIATGLLVSCSFIDKLAKITWYHPHDRFVLIGFVFVTITVYLNEKSNTR